MMKCHIVDYGLCNLLSVANALKYLSIEPVITDDSRQLLEAKAVILPGVGAFNDGMEGLKARDLIQPVLAYADSGRPLLGICLGMQMLMTKSYEFGVFEGLNLIPGEVKRFVPSVDGQGMRMRIPHIGWNGIYPSQQHWQHGLLDGIKPGEDMYFVHSYKVIPDQEVHVLAQTTYIDQTFCSVVKRGNIMGCQFHPEKSSSWGIKILKNFVNQAYNS